ncbi:hypothetical protein GCM10020219_103720 [Nonomuraea dietziae]
MSSRWGRWASRSPTLRHDAEISTDSLALSLKALFAPHVATGLQAIIALKLGEDQLRIEIADSQFHITRKEPSNPDVIIHTDPNTLAALLHIDLSISQALKANTLTIEGPLHLFEQFLTLFPLPQPAPLTEPN